MTQSAAIWPIFAGGTWMGSPDSLVVTRPGSGTGVGMTSVATAEQYDGAVNAACAVGEALAVVASYERSRILTEVAEQILAPRESLAATRCAEAGQLVKESAGALRLTEVPDVRDCGLGREGVWYAMEDMTELRLFVVAMPS